MTGPMRATDRPRRRGRQTEAGWHPKLRRTLVLVAGFVVAALSPATSWADSGPTGSSVESLVAGTTATYRDAVTILDPGADPYSYVNVSYPSGTVVNSVDPTASVTPTGATSPITWGCSSGGTLGTNTWACGGQTISTGATFT